MYDFYKVQKAVSLLPNSTSIEFKQYPNGLKIVSDLPNYQIDIYEYGDPRDNFKTLGKLIKSVNMSKKDMLISDLRLENIIGHGIRVEQGNLEQNGLVVWAFEPE